LLTRNKVLYYISVRFEFEDPQGTSSGVSYAWDNRLIWTSGDGGSGNGNGNGRENEEDAAGGCYGGASGVLALAWLSILLMRRRNAR
jgi:hypothetical protein